MTSYPTVDEVVAVHAQLIAGFGGSLGYGIVAPSNPHWQDGGVAITKDIIQEAAALWERIIRL